MNPNVVFVILNWNGKNFLETCLRSVLGQAYDNFNVVLVDNGSADGSVDFVRREFPLADVLALGENSGYPKGNNAGIKYALGKYAADYILLLNNDTEIREQGWLGGMVSAMESDPGTGIMSCRLVSPYGEVQTIGNVITPYGFKGLDPAKSLNASSAPFAVDAVIGAVFLLKRAVIEKIGLLDEGFSPFSAEDQDYCARARRSGYRIKVKPDAAVVHYISLTISRLPSAYTNSITKRGEIRFRLLNYSLSWLLKFGFFETGNFIAHIFERKDKVRPGLPWNLRMRSNWRENTVVFAHAYLHNLKHLPEILLKRMNRAGKLWY
jgi:GT2 family glycosyltransferase